MTRHRWQYHVVPCSPGTFRMHHAHDRCSAQRVGETGTSTLNPSKCRKLLAMILTNNLLFSSAVVVSGNHYTKIGYFCRCLGLAHPSSASFLRHQRNVVCPVVKKFWQDEQALTAAQIPKGCILMGDGRADSPGHTAENLLYAFIEMSTNRIVHLEFRSVRQVCLIRKK